MWIKPELKPCGYKHYVYVNTWVYYGMTISDKPRNIIKVLDVTFLLQVIKVLCEDKYFYLVSSVVVYYVSSLA